MEALIMDFVRNLNVQKSIYADLLKFAEQKKDIVAKGLFEELNNIVKTEQVMLVKAADAEKKRKKSSDELTGFLKIDGSLPLRQIAMALPEKYSGELLKLHGELSDIIGKLQKTNEINRMLIESRLEYTNFLIGNLSKGSDNTNRYGAAGEDARDTAQRANIIDQKI